MISDFPKKCDGVLWDYLQPNVFIVFDNKICTTFSFVRYSVLGEYLNRRRKLENKGYKLKGLLPYESPYKMRASHFPLSRKPLFFR